MDSTPGSKSRSYLVLLAFASVYIFWGGTYTAARFGVLRIPAPVLAGVRLLLGGSVLLALSRARGVRLWSNAVEMRRIALLGVLLLFTGNVGLVWAEYYLPSGLSALLLAIIPVYVVVIEWLLPHGERLRRRGQAGLLLGLLGLGILAWPSARTGLRGEWHELLAVAVLLLGGLSFAGGSVLSRRSRLSLDPLVCAGWQMLAASVCDVVAATVFRQWSHAHWDRGSVLVIAYLVVFGSVIGFSAYTWLLQSVPVSKVATYAYINPMVAVLLGALLLGERLQGTEWMGMIVILLAVYLVTSSKLQPDPDAFRVQGNAVETSEERMAGASR